MSEMSYNDTKILKDLRHASFSILSRELDKKAECYTCGTGFFISKGLALTTYHNLSTAMKTKKRSGEVDVYYQNMSKPLKLTWRMDWINVEADIAVLQLKDFSDIPSNIPFSYLTPAYLDKEHISEDEHLETFLGRNVYIFGFPKQRIGKRDFLVDRLVKGRISEEVFVSIREIDKNGRSYRVNRLAIDVVGDPPKNLSGISGGAVLDEETKKVIALECSYEKDKRGKGKRIYSSELVEIIEKLPGYIIINHFWQLPPGSPMPLRKEPSLKEALPHIAEIIGQLGGN